jgi:hypothetical protein
VVRYFDGAAPEVAAGRITDRRRKRALAANPASKEPGASKLKRGAAVRVHPMVRLPMHASTGQPQKRCATLLPARLRSS